MLDPEEEIKAVIRKIDDILEMRRPADISTFGSGAAALSRESSDDLLRVNLEAAKVVLSAVSMNLMGECRQEQPYRPLRPIITEDGDLQWCCTHVPPHCVKV
ncbi:hypothetical protein JT55_01910 [Rhodovulum sp. NI22]|nr:hypothetical protein JT55_01910 [Rhodovulum sp. NI22]